MSLCLDTLALLTFSWSGNSSTFIQLGFQQFRYAEIPYFLKFVLEIYIKVQKIKIGEGYKIKLWIYET